MSPSFSLIDAAAQIIAAPCPVIMLDTCCLLDIVRAPMRGGMPASTVVSAKELLQKADPSNRSLWLIITEMVEKEWIFRLDLVEQEVEKSIAITDSQHKTVYQLTKDLAPYIPTPYPASTVTTIGPLALPQRLRQLSEDLVGASLVLEMDERASTRASIRVIDGRAPAKRGGKDSFRDCHIIETFMGLAIELRNQAFKERILFSTSNSNDFCEKPSGKIHPQLDTDLKSCGIEFYSTLSALFHSL